MSNERQNSAWLEDVQFSVCLQVLSHHRVLLKEKSKCFLKQTNFPFITLEFIVVIDGHELQNVPPVGIPPWGKGYEGVVKIE